MQQKEGEERQVFKLLFVPPFSPLLLSLFYSTAPQSLPKLKLSFCKKAIFNKALADFKFHKKNDSEK